MTDKKPRPATLAERQDSFKARKALLGLAEVRGLYLQPALHAHLKEYARKLAEKHTKEAA